MTQEHRQWWRWNVAVVVGVVVIGLVVGIVFGGRWWLGRQHVRAADAHLAAVRMSLNEFTQLAQTDPQNARLATLADQLANNDAAAMREMDQAKRLKVDIGPEVVELCATLHVQVEAVQRILPNASSGTLLSLQRSAMLMQRGINRAMAW